MHKAYFDPVNIESHDELARRIGSTLVSNKTSLYSQHIKGTEIIIVDSLSRDFHRSDQTLTKYFNQILPQHTAGFFSHQTADQERYLIASGSLNASNGIAKNTATKQSENWDRWGTFLKNSGIANKFMEGIPQAFVASLRKNQFI